MPKKLPSSSEAPWITLLAYHQRNLDLATICWKYWGVTEALASLRQHSLHIWSAGQAARILSWLLPSWAGHWQQHQCRQPSTAQHIQAIPWEHSFSNWFTGRSTLQLRNPFEDLTPPPREFCFQKDSLWGSQGRALSTLGHPSIRCAVYSKGCLEVCERLGNIPKKLWITGCQWQHLPWIVYSFFSAVYFDHALQMHLVHTSKWQTCTYEHEKEMEPPCDRGVGWGAYSDGDLLTHNSPFSETSLQNGD